ncbi:MAG: hypothetical protein EOO81_04090, partial [Oxalobacteraceae bacterium]
MKFLPHRLRGAFASKAAITVALVALGDVMFFQMKLYGGAFGLYGLAMLVALAAARPAVIGQSRAVAALALAALYGAFSLHKRHAASRQIAWPLAGLAAAHWCWFTLLLHNPLLVGQHVGPVPLAN